MTATAQAVSLYRDHAWFYDAVARDRPGEIEFYRGIACADEAPDVQGGTGSLPASVGCLELACGSGRLLAPLRAAGAEVWGLDAQPAMLALAELRLAAMPSGTPNHLLQGDLLDDVGRRDFAVVFLALDALRLTADLPALLARCHQHLRPGGVLAADVTLSAGATAATLGPVPHPNGGATTATVTWTSDDTWDVETSRLTTIRPDAAPLSVTVADRFHRLEPDLLRAALTAAGFAVDGWYRDFFRRPWRAGDGMLVLTARRGA